MDLSVDDTLKPFVPKWGSPGEWNEAYEKVENYLRACRINSRLHRARLIHRVLQRVSARGPIADGEALSTAAIRETQIMMEAWFARLLQPTSEGGRYSLVDGRVALLLCDGSDRWPYAFLTTEPNALIGTVHPKAMPVILDEADYDTWLTAEWQDSARLVATYPSQLMTSAQ